MNNFNQNPDSKVNVECDITIPKDQIDLMLVQSNIELIQRVNKLLDMLEKKEDQVLDTCISIINQEIEWVEKQQVFNMRDQAWNDARIQHGKRILDKIKEHFER